MQQENKKVSEYDQEKPQSHTTDQRKIQRILATRNLEHTKALSSLFPSKMIAKLERTKLLQNKTRI